MMLAPWQMLVIVLAVAAATFIERALPFVLFSEKHPAPEPVKYLGRVLPPAMAGVLVIYCLKATSFMPSSFDWRAAVSLAAIIVLHIIKHSTILCVFGGTAVYMILMCL